MQTRNHPEWRCTDISVPRVSAPLGFSDDVRRIVDGALSSLSRNCSSDRCSHNVQLASATTLSPLGGSSCSSALREISSLCSVIYFE
jgi:hypothetical protein